MPFRLILAELALLLFPPFALAQAQQAPEGARLLVQSSPLAGFTHHEASAVWQQLKLGDRLELRREPDNRHDTRAVQVVWRGHLLGYLPRAENREISAEMDAGRRVFGRVGALAIDSDPWKRIRVDVFVTF